jgi:hypothetical protein
MAEKLFVALHKISTRPAGVGFGIIRFQVDDFIIVFDCMMRLAKVIVSNPPAVVGSGIVRFQADGLAIVLNSTLLLAKVRVSNPPVVVGKD